MNLILHGDNVVASRQKLTEHIEEAKKKGVKEVIKLEGKTLSETQLRQALEAKSLFGADKLVVIEKLLSRQRSKEKNKLVDILASDRRPPTASQIILWERKEITKANLNKLRNFQPQLFKTPPAIFKFLDSLKPNNSKQTLTYLHNGLRAQPSELVFYMLSRRVSDLIIAQDKQADALLKGAPWQKGKLKTQAQNFSLKQLTNLHTKLLDIDESIKTGSNLLPLSSQLDLLLAKI